MFGCIVVGRGWLVVGRGRPAGVCLGVAGKREVGMAALLATPGKEGVAGCVVVLLEARPLVVVVRANVLP